MDHIANTKQLKNIASNKKKKHTFLVAIAFLALPLLIYTTFVIIPVIQAVFYSLFKWNGLGSLITQENWRGIKNFILVFQDAVFYKALLHNALIIVLSILFQLPIALILALLIGRNLKGKVLFRSMFFLPFILSEVIAGLIWYFIYHTQFGIANSFLGDIFPVLKSISLLGNLKTTFYAIFVVIWWKYFGLHMVLYIAGLQGIPEELEEAAYVDGANKFQMIWYIILPLLKPTLKISLFFSIIGSFQMFDIIWAMGKGGPVNASETMVTYMYKNGFDKKNLGYACAVAIIIFLICLVFNIIYQRLVLKKNEDYN